MARRLIVIAVVLVAALLLWRPLLAWWHLDLGNLAYARGDRADAAKVFAHGLEFEPGWHALREDHARAILDDDPQGALAEFRAADCGAPCLAGAGDAEIRLGRAADAVNDYLSAHAVDRIAEAANRLARAGRYDDAIALETALVSRLGESMLVQADVAAAYFTIGGLQESAAHADRSRARGYRADAIRSFGRAAALAPFNEGYLLALGSEQAAWGSRDAARHAYERVLVLHPHQTDAESALRALGVAPHAP